MANSRTDPVLIEKPRPNTTVITLNRPERMNSMRLPQPVICAIDGAAIGGGKCLTLRADIRLAGLETASLRAAIGLETHTQLLVRLTTQNFEEAVRARKENRPPVLED